MNEKEYDVLKAKVMESLDGDEIAELIFQYDLNEYSVIKLTPLWQHMRACLCRLGVQRAYGIDLTWSERDVDVLHRVAIDLHNSLTSAKTGFKTNLTAQKAMFVLWCCNVNSFEEIDETVFKNGIDAAIGFIGGMLSEIMMVNLGLSWCEDPEDKNHIVLCSRENLFCDPNLRVERFVLEDIECGVSAFYKGIKMAVEKPILFAKMTEEQLKKDPNGDSVELRF